ncbi:hypothetical protein [Planococcus lenghuensis]|uniref:Uncharacterized protein n=1 Tax=Planococcus lenghuensis TaxID=2213202 RepID=A0A1Q2L2S0_9BACL|nr:hypothetical protein [Planococcus lenghuensis]AQQ54758.1 hypothetical protein B0X71_17725 [Planococcus lenghuensis]
MKNKVVSIFIQTMANVFALWFVFVKKDSWFVSVLMNLGIDSPKAQVGILAALSILLSSIIVLFLEWMLFEIIFKPVHINVSFRNSNGDRAIKQLVVEYSDTTILDVQQSYQLNVSVSEGNKITNSILAFLKSDLVIIYRPSYYDTEIVNGWISKETISAENVYKDKRGNTRVYWSHMVEGANRIDDSVVVSPRLIVKPKNFDGRKCRIELKLGSHSKTNPILRVIFKMIYLKLVKMNLKRLTINLKRIDK